MTKIIVVSGKGNTGKTGSILRFTEKYGKLRSLRPEALLVFKMPRKQCAVGVATAGDERKQIVRSMGFLLPRNCDAIVCASKLNGPTLNYVKSIGGRPGNSIIILQTKWVANNVKAENDRMAKLIAQHIP